MNASITIKLSLIIVTLVFLIGIVGRLDTEDQAQELAIYCDNVSQKVWPDYKNIYKSACKD